MKPDDELLALWVDDELDLAEHREVADWAAEHAEWVTHRELARTTKSLMARAMPSDEEVPHSEFFNARIRREITVKRASAETPTRKGSRLAWFMPAAAAAGMVFGIWIGRNGPSAGDAKLLQPPVAELTPVLYTPEQGVDAEIVASEEATVILLAGVDAIPDSWEIPETAAVEDETEHTASASK